MEGEKPCANECIYSPLEGVRGVEPSLWEGRVRSECIKLYLHILQPLFC